MKFLRLIIKNLCHYANRYSEWRMERRYGIDTAGRIELDTLQIPYPNARHGVSV